MNILHISDIHFRLKYEEYSEGYKGMISKMDNPLIYLKRALDHAKSKGKIDMLLISGDLTEDGTAEDYVFLRHWLKHEISNIPILVTLGNHDIKKNFYQGWLKQEIPKRYYNRICELKDFYIISFDSSLDGETDGYMSNEQFIWLEKKLNACQDKRVLLMTHHHLFECQSNTKPLPQSNKLINLISRYNNIIGFLNGHTHHTYTGDIKGIPYYTAGSMSFVGEDEGESIVRFDQRFGYNLYKIDKNMINHQTTENFIVGKTIDRINMNK